MGNDTIYSLNCTLPPQGVHFVTGPPVRGTLDIAWACLGVIILSTWDAMPESPEVRPPVKGRWAKFKRSVRELLDKLQSMALVLVAPELATVSVLAAYFDARYAFNAYKSTYAAEDGIEWSMQKAYMWAMRKFAIEFDETKYSGKERAKSSLRNSGYTTSDTSQVDLGMLHSGKKIILYGGQMAYLRKIGVLDTFPTITDDEINDRNKTNGLVQFLTVVQVVWLAIQVIARYVEALAVTQLEIATLAFAVLRFVTVLWDWDRPKGLKEPIILNATRDMTAEENRVFESESGTDIDRRVEKLAYGCMSLIGALFGGLHCLAWYEAFPTVVDRTLWRVAAVLTTVVPSVSMMLLNNKIAEEYLYFPAGVYVISRVALIAETTRTLFYQPPTAFLATNIVSLPHFG